MMLRSNLFLAVLLIVACDHGASPGADEPPASADGSSGRDGVPGDRDGATNDGSPGREDGEADGADAGDGAHDGDADVDGDPGDSDVPYVDPPALTISSVDGTLLPTTVVDTNAWVVLIPPNRPQYELWALIRNQGDEPVNLLGLTVKAEGTPEELVGVSQVSAPLCAAGADFEPCLLPGDLGVLTATLLLDRAEQGLDVARMTVSVLGKVLAPGATHVPMTAELRESPYAAVGEYYELSGTLHNDTAYEVSDLLLDVFPRAADGKVLARHRVRLGALAPEGDLSVPSSIRPGHAASSFLWFASGTRTP